jgi:hypothetical protein
MLLRSYCCRLRARTRSRLLVFRAAPTPGASALAEFLARREAEHSDPVAAFDHLTLAIRNYHNSGNTTTIRIPLAILAALFDRLGEGTEAVAGDRGRRFVASEPCGSLSSVR